MCDWSFYLWCLICCLYSCQDATASQPVLEDPQKTNEETPGGTEESASEQPQDKDAMTAEQAAQEKRRLNLKSPIELTSETIVVVGGKKCVLRVDPQTNHLMAYPFQPTPIPGEGD